MGVVDPQGMTAKSLLHTVYARKSATAYSLMSQEAKRRLRVQVRPPQVLEDSLSPRASEECKVLDSWESDTLAHLCRTARHYSDTSKAHTSEYMHVYSPKVNGAPLGRKRFVRRADL